VPLERLLKKPAWLVFGDMVENLRADGCDLERDVWPTVHRIAQRLKEPPASPAYFRDAILEARDRRRVEGTTRAGAQEHADRLAVFRAEGVWSSKWGPRPAPEDAELNTGDGDRTGTPGPARANGACAAACDL
jgi:hypothetical protein